MMSSIADLSTKKSFCALLDCIIPSDSQRGLPSGSQVGLQLETWSLELVKAVDGISVGQHGRTFFEIAMKEQLELISSLSRPHKNVLTRIAKQLAEIYYQRPEVARAVGARVEPPFPWGSRLEDTDWILLEPVFLRSKNYRDV